MKKLIINHGVFDILPDYCIGLVVAKGINNEKKIEGLEELLDHNVKDFLEKYKDQSVREIKNVDAYRQAFYKLQMNPNKFMCFIEALAKRAQKSGVLPHINSVVDLGNALSVKYVLPMGAHDIDQCDANLEVRFSTAEDTFLPLGEKEKENLEEGELVYACAHTVKTRRWIWRQSEDGKITSKSKNLVFVIDGFSNVNDIEVLAARDELVELLKANFSCEIMTGLMNRECNEMVIE